MTKIAIATNTIIHEFEILHLGIFATSTTNVTIKKVKVKHCFLLSNINFIDSLYTN